MVPTFSRAIFHLLTKKSNLHCGPKRAFIAVLALPDCFPIPDIRLKRIIFSNLMKGLRTKLQRAAAQPMSAKFPFPNLPPSLVSAFVFLNRTVQIIR